MALIGIADISSVTMCFVMIMIISIDRALQKKLLRVAENWTVSWICWPSQQTLKILATFLQYVVQSKNTTAINTDTLYTVKYEYPKKMYQKSYFNMNIWVTNALKS